MDIRRKFLQEYVTEPLELMMEDVESKGYDFIEVRHPTQGNTSEIVIGLDEAKVQTSRVPGTPVPIVSNIKIVKDGVVKFYPDKKYFRYGYVLDSERNRNWLASELKRGGYAATDKHIMDEIKKLAKSLGFSTVPVESANKDNIGYGKKDEAKEAELLSERVKELEEELAKAKKPLAGKTIKKKN